MKHLLYVTIVKYALQKLLLNKLKNFKLFLNRISWTKLLELAMIAAGSHEILRVIDSMQLTGRKSLATPADSNVRFFLFKLLGCMILPTLSNEKASQNYPNGFKAFNVPSGKTYIRQTTQS
ncbi:hypothetical protein GQX74_013723 [Glossina fuscipes]|nr:hypothetical protein GQX74_013723 [Glossina fuscipes]